MTRRARLSSLVVSVSLSLAAPAFADAPQVSAEAPSTRAARPFSLSAGMTTTGIGLPLVGLEAEYQLTNRLGLGAALSTALLVVGASANVRYFLTAEPTSGLFLELDGHVFGGLVSAAGGSAELGYQYRARGGFLLEVGAGLFVLHLADSCGCGPPPSVPRESPWHAAPTAALRLGYAF